MSRNPLVVAIDGPAGVGKSTVARRLAARLGVPYLDTGAMYRALALFALEHGLDLDDEASAARAAAEARIELRVGASGDAEVLLDGRSVEARIRSPEVGAATSRIAVHPPVRESMVRLQRGLAHRHGGVLEGRDIGTRVVPDAPFKFYFEAGPQVRAARRWRDLSDADRAALTPDELARQIAERDERDRTRPASPMTPAADAQRIDTGERGVEELVELLAARVRGAAG
jgi:cytidylate kinase